MNQKMFDEWLEKYSKLEKKSDRYFEKSTKYEKAGDLNASKRAMDKSEEADDMQEGMLIALNIFGYTVVEQDDGYKVVEM